LQEKYVLKHRAQAPEGSPQHGEPLKHPLIIAAKSVKKGERLKRQSEKNVEKKKKKKKKD
jgi:hypothetical protein